MLRGLTGFRTLAGVFVIFLTITSSSSSAGDRISITAKLVALPPDGTKESKVIEGVSWKSADSIPIEIDPHAAPDRQVSAIIEGQYQRENWTLVAEERVVIDPAKSQGRFRLRIPLKSDEARITFHAVDFLGRVETQSFKIGVSEWGSVQRALEEARKTPESKRFSISTGLGPTFLSYRQTAIPDFTSILINAKVFAQYWLTPKKWDLAVGGYYTLLPLSSSEPDTRMRFLGLNARAGYLLPWIKEPWQLSLFGGWYYATTFATDDRLGYTNLSGPQLSPLLRRSLPSGGSVAAYFKFSPVSDQFAFLSLENREIAFGGSWNLRPNAKGQFLSVQLDFANLKVQSAQGSTQVSSTTYSLGAGYSW